MLLPAVHPQIVVFLGERQTREHFFLSGKTCEECSAGRLETTESRRQETDGCGSRFQSELHLRKKVGADPPGPPPPFQPTAHTNKCPPSNLSPQKNDLVMNVAFSSRFWISCCRCLPAPDVKYSPEGVTLHSSGLMCGSKRPAVWLAAQQGTPSSAVSL